MGKTEWEKFRHYGSAKIIKTEGFRVKHSQPNILPAPPKGDVKMTSEDLDEFEELTPEELEAKAEKYTRCWKEQDNCIQAYIGGHKSRDGEVAALKALCKKSFKTSESLTNQIQMLTDRVNELLEREYDLENQVKGINRSCSKLHAAWERVKDDITEMFQSRDSKIQDLQQSVSRIERKVLPDFYTGYDEEFLDQMTKDIGQVDWWAKYSFKKWREWSDKKKQEKASEYTTVKSSRLEKVIDFLKGKDVK